MSKTHYTYPIHFTKMKKLKIAAIGDLHIKETSKDLYKDLFAEISKKAQVLVLCGDLTDLGLTTEAEILAEELAACTIPVVGVLGNHDYENDNVDEVKKILTEAKLHLLENDSIEIEGVGFAGVKGFGGGFDNHMLGAFGEHAIKNYVQEVINESLRLEYLLGQLQTEKKVAVMHYAPIKTTCEGESPEIFTYLGSSRLAEPIDNFNVTAVFHGHAHHGTHIGETNKGISVYNCSKPVMEKINPKQPYALVEL